MELQLNYISLFPCIAWPVYLLNTTNIWLNVFLTLYGLGLSHQSNIQTFKGFTTEMLMSHYQVLS